ncbi:Helicase swr1 [Hondaea fermentalgiana]|uniref:Helicase swr1 n=1 Tax=Hondaea fermentalgiana TaxID=2315210 RepID=A0A2R5GHP1_9STRA|nr:Helicase swr1 [Hondaea fermentalgiana]|eukprot:GBG30402.1 Helicase swr1 [Hondaea fermentalgiana]
MKRKMSMSSQQSASSASKKKSNAAAGATSAATGSGGGGARAGTANAAGSASATAAAAAGGGGHLAASAGGVVTNKQRSGSTVSALSASAQTAGVKRKRQEKKPLAARQRKMNAKLLDFLSKRKALMAQREVHVARVAKLRASLGTAMIIQPEAPRTRSHWDTVLEEMMWMATDFIEERKFKGSVTSRLAYAAKVQHAERQIARELAAKRLEERHKSISDLVATHVCRFWDATLRNARESKRPVTKQVLDFDRIRYVPDRTEKVDGSGPRGEAALEVLHSEADEPIDEKLAELVQTEADIETRARKYHAASLAIASAISSSSSSSSSSPSSSSWLQPWPPAHTQPVDDSAGKADEVSEGETNGELEEEDNRATRAAHNSIAKLMAVDDDEKGDDDYEPEQDIDNAKGSPEETDLWADDEASIAEQERLFPDGDNLGATELYLLSRDLERPVEDVVADAMRPRRMTARVKRGLRPGTEPVDAEDEEDEEDEKMADRSSDVATPQDSANANGKSARKGNHAKVVDDDSEMNEAKHVDQEDEEADDIDDKEEDEEEEEVASDVDEEEMGRSIRGLAEKLPIIPQKDLTARVKAFAALARAVRAVCKARNKGDPIRVPPRLMPPSALEAFFPHQQVALHWLASMHRQRLGAVLADDRGLGKEAVVVAFLGLLAGEVGAWGPHLIVTTPARAFQWRLHLLNYCPALRVTRRVHAASSHPQPGVTILTQEEAATNEAALSRQRWHTLVWDLVDIDKDQTEAAADADADEDHAEAKGVAASPSVVGTKDDDGENGDEDEGTVVDPEVVLRRLPLLRSTMRLAVTANEAEAKANATNIAFFLLPFAFLGSSSKEKQWASKKSANAWRDCVQAFTLCRRSQDITGIDDVDVDRETKNFGPTPLQVVYKDRLLSAYNKLTQKLTPRGNRDTKTRHLGMYSMCLFSVGCHPDSMFPRAERSAFAMSAVANEIAALSARGLPQIAVYPWQIRSAHLGLYESPGAADDSSLEVLRAHGITPAKMAAGLQRIEPGFLAWERSKKHSETAEDKDDDNGGAAESLKPWKPPLDTALPSMNAAMSAALNVSTKPKTPASSMQLALRQKYTNNLVPTEGRVLSILPDIGVVSVCVSVLGGGAFAESALHVGLNAKSDPRPELSGVIKSLPGVIRRLASLDFGTRKILVVAHDPALLLPAQAMLTLSRIRYLRVEGTSAPGTLAVAIRQFVASSEVRVLMAGVNDMDALLGAEMELEHGLGLLSAVVVLDEPGVGTDDDPLTDRIDAIALAHARRRALRGEPEETFYVEDLQVDFNMNPTGGDVAGSQEDESTEGSTGKARQPKVMELSEVTAALERVRKRTNEDSLDIYVKQAIDEFLGRVPMAKAAAVAGGDAAPALGSARPVGPGLVVLEERELGVDDFGGDGLRDCDDSTAQDVGASPTTAGADAFVEEEFMHGDLDGALRAVSPREVSANPLLGGFLQVADHSFEEEDDDDEDDEEEDEDDEETATTDAPTETYAHIAEVLQRALEDPLPPVKRALLREPGTIAEHMRQFSDPRLGGSLLVVDTRRLRKDLFASSLATDESAALDDAQSSASLASHATTRPAEALMSDATWLNQTSNYEPLFYEVDPELSKQANMERLLVDLERDSKVIGASAHVYGPPFEPEASSAAGVQHEEALPSAPPMLGFQAPQTSAAGNGFSGAMHATSGVPQRPKFAVSFMKQRIVAMSTDLSALEIEPVKRRSASIDDESGIKKRKIERKNARTSSIASSADLELHESTGPSDVVRLDSTVDVEMLQDDEDEAPGLAPPPSSTTGKEIDWGIQVPKVKARLKGAQKKSGKSANDEDVGDSESWTAWEDVAMLRAVEVFGPSWDLVQHLVSRPLATPHSLQQVIDRYHFVRSKYKTAAAAPWIAKHERSVRDIAPWATPPLHKTDLLLHAPVSVKAFEAVTEPSSRLPSNDFLLRRKAGLPTSLGRKGFASFAPSLALPEATTADREKCSNMDILNSNSNSTTLSSISNSNARSCIQEGPFLTEEEVHKAACPQWVAWVSNSSSNSSNIISAHSSSNINTNTNTDLCTRSRVVNMGRPQQGHRTLSVGCKCIPNSIKPWRMDIIRSIFSDTQKDHLAHNRVSRTGNTKRNHSPAIPQLAAAIATTASQIINKSSLAAFVTFVSLQDLLEVSTMSVLVD